MFLGQPVKTRDVPHRHPTCLSTQRSWTYGVRGQLKREKIGGNGSTWMGLTVLDKWTYSERILCEQTHGGRIKRPHGIQLVIMWSPRNPKWKRRASQD